jgi:hypothetical protein
MKLWLSALGATMLMQLVASFMGQSLPVLAPLMMASTGLAPERVGNLSSLTALATVLYLTRIIHDPLRLVDFLPLFSAETNS